VLRSWWRGSWIRAVRRAHYRSYESAAVALHTRELLRGIMAYWKVGCILDERPARTRCECLHLDGTSLSGPEWRQA
jgi:hypothetical protein